MSDSSLDFNDCWFSVHRLDDDNNLQRVPVTRKASDLDFQRRVAGSDWYCGFGTALKQICGADSLDDDLVYDVSGIVEVRLNCEIGERQSLGCEMEPIERRDSTKPVVRYAIAALLQDLN